MTPPSLKSDFADSTLFSALVEASKVFGSDHIVIEDADGQKLTYKRLILGSFVLGSKLSKDTRNGEAIGVLLPNVAGLLVTIFGLNVFGRVAALLNFTAGPRNISSAAQTAIVRRVVTSRRFVEAAKLDSVIEALSNTEVAPGQRVEIVYLEDVRANITLMDKAMGAIRALSPLQSERRHSSTPDKPAVILFTSGTEGAPKGVVLSNANLVGNARQIFTHATGHFEPTDTIFNPLPMFHSFGLTAASLMPLLSGMSVALYPSPLHYKEVPRYIRRTNATALFATDTFLQGYARAAEAGDLKTIRLVVAGAERVKDGTRKLWDKYGSEILEGYGATECSPVIACNLPSANRPGTVGRILPGIETKLEPVEGISEGGKLLVRGVNVMSGYMRSDAPGIIDPPADGWHDTGDIVTIADGFVSIRGRAKRFAKIGGEMISLAAVESFAADLWPDAQHVVVSLPDPRKGEQLVLVTDFASADKASLLKHARSQGFPELWAPKAVMVVKAIPVMGSGKVDLPATTAMAQNARPLL